MGLKVIFFLLTTSLFIFLSKYSDDPFISPQILNHYNSLLPWWAWHTDTCLKIFSSEFLIEAAEASGAVSCSLS